MKKLISTFFLSFLFAQSGIAQINLWESPRDDQAIISHQWEVNDVVYEIRKSIDAPFDKEVYAIVSDESGEQKIPLFYNGDKKWVFRYSSSTTGSKSFVLESEIKELNSKKGSFLITENVKQDRHGAVVLNQENPQHLFYEDGTHYFNLAFECDWLFALDYGQEKLSKTEHLLSLIDEYGFNQIVMNVYAYDVAWPKDERLLRYPEHEYGSREDIFPFLGSNSHPDFSALNIKFFQHLDRVMAAMHEKEIVSHLMIYVWNKLVNWPEMDSKADNRYYDYVIKRYQAFPNIIWDVSKEAVSKVAQAQGRSTEAYILERIERSRELDAFKRLLTVHSYGFCRKHADEVDIISMQNWRNTLYQHMLDARKEFPDKPIFNIEHGGYEESPYVVFPGAYANAEICLRRNYMCLFAGGYTTYYWQGTSWNAVIHNPFEQADHFSKPHFEYFSHMKKLFDQISFEHCVPYPQGNSSGYNLTNEEDGIILMYTPKENHYISPKVQISKDFHSDKATQQWFNTRTGEMTKEEAYVPKEWGFWDWRPWRGEADAILIIRNLKKK